DKLMALRFNRYITEFYFSLIKRKKIYGKLPSVFPVLVYSGKSTWNAPVELQDLISNDIPKRYIPSLKYYQICINEYKRDDLEKMHSALSAAMIAENTNPEEVDRNFSIIKEIIKKENASEVNDLKNFLLNLFDKSKETEYINRKIEKLSLEEGMSIFTESFKRKEKEDIQKGIKEGISKGIEKGIEKGKIEDARRMLNKGCDIEFVSEITGLSRRKISALKKK
ncbi:MAG: Rpn family recombination-promoting nuclease/putative transposase, partial [Fibrobacterota bacterium]